MVVFTVLHGDNYGPDYCSTGIADDPDFNSFLQALPVARSLASELESGYSMITGSILTSCP